MGLLLKSFDDVRRFVEEERRRGKSIVFTNGCFDILHAGHVDYLERAKSFGDILIVGVNSDASIRRIKGDKRPILPQGMRVRVLLGLRCVDAVSVFDEDTPYELIRAVEPDVLVKGADWRLEDIVGREFAGRVERIPFSYNVSTSAIVDKILKTYGKDR